ncbi:MAG: hypothetical protein EA363_11760 [Balneolaceae bacterium]|nr:MAG: hypothetical protein EA363_11760 [Balneolaceae bacterium]
MTKGRTTTRNLIQNLLLLCAVFITASGCSGDGARDQVRDKPNAAILAVSPGSCTLEFSYAIGDIDPRFRISRNEVRQTVEQALDLWAGAVDRLDVRLHDGIRAGEEARNTIHFEYDERQELSDRARRFQDQIASKGGFIDQMHREYERDQRELERRTDEHRRLSGRLNGEIERLNAWIESVNEGGGFRQEQLGAYEKRMDAIEALRQREREMRSDLERSVAAINRSADRINREVDFHDDMVRQFYREFGDGSRFNSALYRFDGTSGTITVHHFHNRRELKVILAHEIGHALGLGHVPDSRSIMYETIRDQLLGREIALSAEDIRAVRALCR